MNASAGRLRDPQQRADRATRILDAAAELVLRHGYRRVSIDDVAAAAGIGKGTVYLHWKSREQLFGAVFAREVLAALDELRQALRREAHTCLLHRFARSYFLAIVRRPLMRGLLLNDPDLLGRLAGSTDTARDDRHATMTHRYFELLTGHGLLRDDMSLDELAYAYQATFEGFLRAENPALSPDQRAELLAQTTRRAFEHQQMPPDSTLHTIAATTAALLDELIAADCAEYGIPVP